MIVGNKNKLLYLVKESVSATFFKNTVLHHKVSCLMHLMNLTWQLVMPGTKILLVTTSNFTLASMNYDAKTEMLYNKCRREAYDIFRIEFLPLGNTY